MTHSSIVGEDQTPLGRPEAPTSSYALRQLASYDISPDELNDTTKSHVSVPKALFIELLQLALAKVSVDNDWYRSKYPDFYAQELRGHFESPTDHYTRFGFFENRLPHRIDIDLEFYGENNPDIKELTKGSLSAMQAHFENYGFKEGRRPRQDWNLSCLSS